MPRYHLTIKDRTENGVSLPPCHAITVGKLDFRRYTSIPTKIEGQPDRIYTGAVAEHKAEEVAEFRELVKRFVVRWNWREKGSDGRPVDRRLWGAQVIATRVGDKPSPNFFPLPERDEPLEKYLDVREIPSGLPEDLVGVGVSADQVAAEQEAQANEARARSNDKSDEARRRVHGRAKAAGESLPQ